MIKLKESTLSSKDQVTISKKVREKLGVNIRDTIVFYFDNDIKLTNEKNVNIVLKDKKFQSSLIKGESNEKI